MLISISQRGWNRHPTYGKLSCDVMPKAFLETDKNMLF